MGQVTEHAQSSSDHHTLGKPYLIFQGKGMARIFGAIIGSGELGENCFPPIKILHRLAYSCLRALLPSLALVLGSNIHFLWVHWRVYPYCFFKVLPPAPWWC
jgi:hypothetical protein